MLANISLSFFPGAKIGVLGPNGAGKSTLLRIMAGREESSRGEAALAPGATVGLLEQEPELDAEKDVRGNVEDGVRELRDLLDRFQDVSARFAEPDADFDAARRTGEGARGDRPPRRLDARGGDRSRDGRVAAARRRPRRDDAVRRRAAARRALPAAALVAGPAAARRADEPPRRRVGALARALPRRVQGHGRRRHPRPLLPRQRRRLDPRARPRPRHSVPGQLLVVARAEASAARDRGEAGVRAPPHARPRARVGAHEPARAPREVEGAPRRLREAVRRGGAREARPRRDPHPAGPAPRRPRDRGGRPREGLRRPPPLRGRELLAAAGRHRRCDRAQRRRQDDACSG